MKEKYDKHQEKQKNRGKKTEQIKITHNTIEENVNLFSDVTHIYP